MGRDCVPKPAWPHARGNRVFVLEPFSLPEDVRDAKGEVTDYNRNADL